MAFNTVVRKDFSQYLDDTKLHSVLEDAVNACYAQQPSNAGIFMAHYFANKFSPAIIDRVDAVEQLDASCGATLQIRIVLHSGASAAATVSHSHSFAHPSTHRNKLCITDKKERNRFAGMQECGVRAAQALTRALSGRNVHDQRGVDDAIKAADGTLNLACLGANICAAASACAAQLSADLQHLPPFLTLAPLFHLNGRPSKFHVPTPVVTLFSCEPPMFGKTRLREVCIIPSPLTPLSTALRQLSRVTECAVEKLADDAQSPSVNTDGSLKYTSFDAPSAAIELAEDCIKDAGLIAGQDIFVGLVIDGALSHKHESHKYSFMDTAGEWSGAQLAEFLATLVKEKKSLVYLEDTHNEKDTQEMRRLMARVGNVICLCGTNAYAGDVNAIAQGAKEMQTNTMGLKLNDFGTITDAIAGARQFVDAYPGASLVTVSELSEHKPEFSADFATAIGSVFFRCGGLLKANHVAGYNRLAVIEARLKDMGIWTNSQTVPSSRGASSQQPSKSTTPAPGAEAQGQPQPTPSTNVFSYRFEHLTMPPAPLEAVADVPLKDAKKKK